MKSPASLLVSCSGTILGCAAFAVGLLGSQLHAQTNYATPYAFTTLAGTAGLPAAVNGIGAAARFNNPIGLAVDAAGNLYVAEEPHHTIRRVTPAGVVTTFAGVMGIVGTANGPAENARFFGPTGVAIDSAGNLYVADRGNHVVRKITPAGVVSTLAGGVGSSGYADGPGALARFRFPGRIAVDRSGTIYVSDQDNHAIRKVTPEGVVTTLAGGGTVSSGYADGTGAAARFATPLGVAVDATGNVYVADLVNESIRKITPAGVVTTLAGLAGTQGTADGTGSAARFLGPTELTVDASGNLFVADAGAHTIRRITPAGEVTTVAGSPQARGSTDGTGSAARFNNVYGVAFDAAGNLFVADRGNHTIRLGVAATAALAFTTQPVAQTVPPGATATFIAVASGPGPITYEWRRDNVPIAGATTATLTLTNVSAAVAGTYTAVASSAAGSITSNPAVLALDTGLNASRLVNLSILTSLAGAGDSFTLGYVVGGRGTTGAKPLVIRAAGPALASLGVAGALADPQITLFAGSTQSGANDNWGGSGTLLAAMNSVGAFPFASAASLDAAIATSVAAGDNSVRVSPVGNLSGQVIAEIYDATPDASFVAATPRLVNVSVLKNIGPSLAAGFVIRGDTGPRTVLIRAVGPTLGAAPFNVPGVVADPQLVLFSGQTQIGANDNWGGGAALSAAFTAVSAFALPANSRDAALLVTLAPGNYSVVVTGANGGSGTALVEVYEVP